MPTETTNPEVAKGKILNKCGGEMSRVIRACEAQERKVDPFGALVSIMSKAVDEAFDAGMIEGNCGECGAHD